MREVKKLSAVVNPSPPWRGEVDDSYIKTTWGGFFSNERNINNNSELRK
jgi:hypothetical protein